MASYYNLEDIANDHCQNFLDSSQKKEADLKRPIFNWDALFVVYGPTNYTERQPILPTHNTVFKSYYENHTEKSQTFTLKTKRSTVSSSSLTLIKTFTYGGNISLKLGLPHGLAQANAAFQSNITKEKGVTHLFEHEVKWSIDTDIEVPPKHKASAELVIKQEHFDGTFTVLCVFDGSVMVTYETKKNRELVCVVTTSISNMLQGKAGFSSDLKGRPKFTVEGTCQCRFGIDQKVVLTQTPL